MLLPAEAQWVWEQLGRMPWFVEKSMIGAQQNCDSLQTQRDWQQNAAQKPAQLP